MTETGTFSVVGPSGATHEVLTEQEVEYWEGHLSRYMSNLHFSNISDLQELDRVLMQELMVWRWGNWLSMGVDYFGDAVDERILQDQIKSYSTELRLLKKSLGIDKASRDKDRGETVAEYIENLRRRAKEFGYHREKQLSQALILFNDLIALTTLMNNCTPDEQRENHCTPADVLQWIQETAIPEYQAIDEHFRKNQQSTWVREL